MTSIKRIGQLPRKPFGGPKLVGLAAAMALVSSFAQAQAQTGATAESTEAAGGGLQEIVVTATRRASNLQSTPIAVTSIDAQALENLNARSLQDVALLVPNFSANRQNGFNAAAFAMRGVGNTDIIVYDESPVAVIVDDFVVQSVETQMLDPFDVEDLEVLRGPQGTLFGKNTTGGAVVVKTKAPVLDETSLDTEGGFGSFNEFNVKGALNIPLIDHQLAMRVVASEEREDGWMRNGASNTIGGVTYTGNGEPVGGTDVFTGRAKLLWQPMDNLRVLFTYEQLNDRSQVPAAVNATPTNDTPGTNTPYFDFALLGLPGYTGNNPLGNAGVDNRNGYLVDEQNGQRVDANGET